MSGIDERIPVRLLEDLDDTLAFSQSRSAKISRLISQDIEGDGRQGISEDIRDALQQLVNER